MAEQSICPKCGGPIPEDTLWTFRQKFYCSEECVRLVVKPPLR